VFRAQLSVENARKALLGYLGVEHGPTHFPSVLLGKILSEKDALKRLDFSREQIELLLAIASKASALEAHGAMPRYGWETSERIIVPSEVYKKEVAENVLNLAVKTIDSIAKFFEQFSLPAEMKRILQQLKEVI